jgi:hypothetical protein
MALKLITASLKLPEKMINNNRVPLLQDDVIPLKRVALVDVPEFHRKVAHVCAKRVFHVFQVPQQHPSFIS